MLALKFLKKLSQSRSFILLQDSSKVFPLSGYSQKSFFASTKSDRFDKKQESSQEAEDEAERYAQFADPLSQEFSSSSREVENLIVNTKRRAEEVAKKSGSDLNTSKTDSFKSSSLNQTKMSEDLKSVRDDLKSMGQDLKDTIKEGAKDALGTKESGAKTTRNTEGLRESLRGVAQVITERFGNGFGTIGSYARQSADNVRPNAPTGKEAIGSFAPGSAERKPKEGPGLGGLSAESTREKPDLRASAREEQRLRGGTYSKTGNTQTGFVDAAKSQSSQERKEEQKELKEETLKREPELSREMEKPGKDMIDVHNTSDWTKIIQSDKPIVVDFYKPGDGECRRLYPHLLDRFTQSSEAWVLVGANVELMGDLAKQMKVESVPTVLLIHKGKVLEQSVGTRNVDNLIEKANEISRDL